MIHAMADDIAEALQQLVDRLDEVHEHPAYKSVWTLYVIHGMRYDGPTYVDALAKARKALQAHNDPQPDAVYKLGQATEAEAVRNRAADWPPDA